LVRWARPVDATEEDDTLMLLAGLLAGKGVMNKRMGDT
jgi:hypothetical protein